jgi:L-aminopeptidase/D-esterase-like protein
MGAITDVPGLRVGHAQRVGGGWLTGVTVVAPPPGTTGMVDIAGAAPATREVSGHVPGGAVTRVDAVALTGGSSWGLIAADGVMKHLRSLGRGHPVEAGGLVPIVPAAAIYDLGRGGLFDAWPTQELGQEAAQAAFEPGGATPPLGRVGAGTGATIDNERGWGGVGSASARLSPPSAPSLWLGALVVVNAFGVPTSAVLPDAVRSSQPDAADRSPARAAPPFNTVLAVVATDAHLDDGSLWRLARTGQDGIARSFEPAHTLADGDTVFALSTHAVRADFSRDGLIAIQAGSAAVVEAAVRDALARSRMSCPQD